MNTNQRASLQHGLPLVFLCGFLLLSHIASAAVTAEPHSRSEIKRLVIKEAERAGLPPSLALAVAKVESDFQTHALSRDGAQGIMQVHPQIGRSRYGLTPEKLWNPQLNIELGLDYLSHLINRYHGQWDLALSHYSSHFTTGSPLLHHVTPATNNYVDQVLRWQQRYEDQALIWLGATQLQPASLNHEQPESTKNTAASALTDDAMDKFNPDSEERVHARRYLDDFSAW